MIVPRLDMKEMANQLVTILGQVSAPGSYEMETPTPLLDVLILAGNVLGSADLKNVSIVSRSEEGEGTSRQVNVEDIFSKDGNPQSLGSTIFPGDIIFIPGVKELEERKISVNVIGQVKSPGV